MDDDERMAKMKCIFSLFDKNGDGVVCVDEIGMAMRATGQNPTQAELTQLIEKYDADGTQKIDFPEFVELMTQHLSALSPEEELQQAFALFDSDGSGFLDKQELRKIVTIMGNEPIAEDQLDEIMGDIDVDGDGRINIKEFVTFMSN